MLIVALNGLLGTRDKRLDMTEIVEDAMRLLPIKDAVDVIKGRGGAGPVAFHKLCRRVKRRADGKTTLLLVGKSYGGHWCRRLLWRLADKNLLERFHAVGMVTVDPAYALHKLQRKMKQIPEIDIAINIHQYGKRSGYRLGPPAENIVVKAKHGNIEMAPIVTKKVEDLFLWGHAKRCR
jgi:hypothetical protein